MSARLTPLDTPVTLDVDGEPIHARAGEPVAAALLAADAPIFARSAKYHRPRGPYCFGGGGCAGCLMRVDGVPNVPTCQVPAREGLRIERQNALPDARLDALRGADFFFHDWFDHNEFLATVPIAEAVLRRVTRQLSGLGRLPDAPCGVTGPAVIERHRLLIIGGGAAGLAAARRLDERGHDYLLLERDAEVGGRLLLALEPDAPYVWQPPSDRLRTGSTVVGAFDDDGRPFVAAVTKGRLGLLFFQRVLLASGGRPFLPTFPNNDLPGIFAGRAAATLLLRHRVLPGRRVACVGDAAEAEALAGLLRAEGAEAVAVGATPLRAHGLRRVRALTVREQGEERRVDCDAVALCGVTEPGYELAAALGAKVAWDTVHRCFVVEAGADGRTAASNVFVAGEAQHPMSAATAAARGRAAADAMVGGAS